MIYKYFHFLQFKQLRRRLLLLAVEGFASKPRLHLSSKDGNPKPLHPVHLANDRRHQGCPLGTHA